MEENNEELPQPGLFSFPSVHTWFLGVLLTQAGGESQTGPKRDQVTERFLTSRSGTSVKQLGFG